MREFSRDAAYGHGTDRSTDARRATTLSSRPSPRTHRQATRIAPARQLGCWPDLCGRCLVLGHSFGSTPPLRPLPAQKQASKLLESDPASLWPQCLVISKSVRRTMHHLSGLLIVPTGNVGKSNAGLDLLGSLGLEGGSSLAARLAARRRQQNDSGGKTETSDTDGAPRTSQRSASSGTPRMKGDRRPSAPRQERSRDDRARAHGRWEGQLHRGNSNNRGSRPERRAAARSTAGENSALAEEEAAEEVKTSRPRVEVRIQDEGNKIAVTASELDKLFAGTLSSDPTALAAAVKPYGRNLQNEDVARRTQHVLEKRGGDYSRYLPVDLGTSFPEQLGPLGSARLVMGHRPDVGLKSREKLLGTVQSLVVNKVIDGQPATNA